MNDTPTPEKTRVLFLCTGNACRSQMAEALLRHMAGERFEPFSAGFRPAAAIHPLAAEMMQRMRVSTEGQRPKHWDALVGEQFDVVITLCDSAACLPQPDWPGEPARAHWGLPDPATAGGTEEQRRGCAAFVANKLAAWIRQFAELPVETLGRVQVTAELESIGRS